jgi:hypothetical protein
MLTRNDKVACDPIRLDKDHFPTAEAGAVSTTGAGERVVVVVVPHDQQRYRSPRLL